MIVIATTQPSGWEDTRHTNFHAIHQYIKTNTEIGVSWGPVLEALESGVELIAEIGMEALVAKSRALSAFFLECVADLDLDLVSPRDPAARGSQLSFRHENAYALSQALIARGVIGDFRAPDVVRFGFTPLYLSHADVLAACDILEDIVKTRGWDKPEFHKRAKVT